MSSGVSTNHITTAQVLIDKATRLLEGVEPLGVELVGLAVAHLLMHQATCMDCVCCGSGVCAPHDVIGDGTVAPPVPPSSCGRPSRRG